MSRAACGECGGVGQCPHCHAGFVAVAPEECPARCESCDEPLNDGCDCDNEAWRTYRREHDHGAER